MKTAFSFHIKPGSRAPVGAAVFCGCTPSVEAERFELRVRVDDVTGALSSMLVPSVGLMLVSDFGRKSVRARLRGSLRLATRRRVDAVAKVPPWSTPGEEKTMLFLVIKIAGPVASNFADRNVAIICMQNSELFVTLIARKAATALH